MEHLRNASAHTSANIVFYKCEEIVKNAELCKFTQDLSKPVRLNYEDIYSLKNCLQISVFCW